jgi:hypothetical protein
MCARCEGRISKLSISENARARQTTTGIPFDAGPHSPGKKNIGAKNTIVLMTAKTTGFTT